VCWALDHTERFINLEWKFFKEAIGTISISIKDSLRHAALHQRTVVSKGFLASETGWFTPWTGSEALTVLANDWDRIRRCFFERVAREGSQNPKFFRKSPLLIIFYL